MYLHRGRETADRGRKMTDRTIKVRTIKEQKDLRYDAKHCDEGAENQDKAITLGT